MKRALLLLLVCGAAFAQTLVVNGWGLGGGGSTNFSSGTLAARPATCTVGSGFYMYLATDQAAGKQIFNCVATNTWAMVAGTGPSGQLQILSSGLVDTTTDVPSKANANLFTGQSEWALPSLLDYQGSAPSNPAAGKIAFYSDNGGAMHVLTPGGVNTTLGAGSSGILWEKSGTLTASCTTTSPALLSGATFSIPINTLVVGGRVVVDVTELTSSSWVVGSGNFPYITSTFGAVGATGQIQPWMTTAGANPYVLQWQWLVAATSSQLGVVANANQALVANPGNVTNNTDNITTTAIPITLSLVACPGTGAAGTVTAYVRVIAYQ